MSSTRTHSPVDTVDPADTDHVDNTADDDYDGGSGAGPCDGGSGAGPDIADPDSGLGNQLERLQVQVLLVALLSKTKNKSSSFANIFRSTTIQVNITICGFWVRG